MLPSSSVEALELQAIGRYELLLELGRGGMAVLYLARAQGVGGFSRLFAIKRILPHLAVDPAFVEMFLNEGRIAARLSHPHLCPVFELGQDRGELFLVMDYLDGVPWEALAAAAPHDAHGLALAAGVLVQACDGLHHAHTFCDVDGTAMPIIHRDVSPQNVFVSTDGVCRVLDFGVSKIASDRRRTATGLLKGKLPYMAPEQLHGERADARTDIWAVGVMLWEALTGQRLFDRDTDFLTYQAIVDAPIPSVNAASSGAGQPRYPAAIDHVIAGALSRDRDARYATARDLARDLSRAVAEIGGPATREQIAGAVATLCGDRLAARRRDIAEAIARRAPALSSAPATPSAADPDAASAAATGKDAAETISMMMRRDAIVVERSPRRRGRIGALAAAAVAVAVGIAGIAIWRAGAERTSSVSPQPASFADDSPAMSAPARAPADTSRPADPDRATVERSSPPETSAAGTQRASAAIPPGRPRAQRARADRPAASSSPTGPRPSPHSPSPELARPTELAAAGWYAIDSNPYATIFIDDRKIGDTPLDHIPLPAGAHRVRAVLSDGRQRSFAIDIAADHKTTSGTLTW